MAENTHPYLECTGETKQHWSGATLHRIRATKDLPRFAVQAGDWGGWVENLNKVSDNAWVSGDAVIFGNASVSGDAWVFGDAEVSGNASVYRDVWGSDG